MKEVRDGLIAAAQVAVADAEETLRQRRACLERVINAAEGEISFDASIDDGDNVVRNKKLHPSAKSALERAITRYDAERPSVPLRHSRTKIQVRAHLEGFAFELPRDLFDHMLADESVPAE